MLKGMKKSKNREQKKGKIQNKVEINKIKSIKTIHKTNKIKSLFFEKINQTDKHLTRLIKRKRERTQMNKIKDEIG